MKVLLIFLVLHPGLRPLYAQPAGAAEIQLNLQKLDVVGSVLLIAAHPDDEDNSLLAYFARGRHLRTGYLSLTRGEGGQNLIGSEQGSYLGLLRTQELLAARRIDGAEQFFTRAIDFGFSKTPAETLEKWGREQVLSDVVWVIRSYRPDVIVLRFSGTSRDGHGQHQASAILGKEAFSAAADPSRFPEQMRHGVKPWKARRLYFNLFSFTNEDKIENKKIQKQIETDIGELNPILGLSYGEIAGLSRSMHASQGMGTAEMRGSIQNQLALLAGEPAEKDAFEGIDLSWRRLPGGDAVAPLIARALQRFRPEQPSLILPALLKARPLVAAIQHPDAQRKLRELDETIALAAGLWLDASASPFSVTPGSQATISISMLSRLHVPVTVEGVTLEGMLNTPEVPGTSNVLPFNQPVQHKLEWRVPADAAYTQPFWLAKQPNGLLYAIDDQRLIGPADNTPIVEARFHLAINGVSFTAVRPVLHRYVDRERGELARPFLIVPPVTVDFGDASVIFANTEPRTIAVIVKSNQTKVSGRVRLQAPAAWKITPAEAPFDLQELNQQTALIFTVTPPAKEATGTLKAVVETGGREIVMGQRVIAYPHIPPQTVFPLSTARLVRADIRILSHNIGYIMGAGDNVPEALRQLGVVVTMLSDDDLATGELRKYDAIVTGVRVFNTRPSLRANFQRLLDYASDGGTLVVQYNVEESYPGAERSEKTAHMGPYPFQLGRERVTVEEAPVMFSDPDHPLLRSPNRITAKDFDGWVQERGLYFPKQFDARYQSLFASHDPGEDWLPGGTLYTKYGKGAYVYTSYSWFRELPAGVPGAFRIFANLLSAGKIAK